VAHEIEDGGASSAATAAAGAAQPVAEPGLRACSSGVSYSVGHAVAMGTGRLSRGDARPAEWKAHCDLIRCISGNPFRELPTWPRLTDPVGKMVEAIYDAGDFGGLPNPARHI
jgi:hypothetical protein